MRTSARLVVVAVLCSMTALTQRLPQADATSSTRTFTVTNSHEDWVVPAGVTELSFVAKGANASFGGYGAYVAGTITVTPGETLRVYVGGQGSVSGGTGGYPNGGYGGGSNFTLHASGGGGSTHIVTADMNETPIVVAGGGGGGTNFGIGGAGGYNGDDAPTSWVTHPQLDGRGGTQSAGGAATCDLSNVCSAGTAGRFMYGGDGLYGAGGGGGYWGGSGGNGELGVPDNGSYSDYGGAGGGGSSYVDPTRLVGMPSPTFQTGWSDTAGSLTLTWTANSTSSSSSSTSTSSSTSSSTSTSTTSPSTTSTTLPPITPPNPTSTTTVTSSTTPTPIQWLQSDTEEAETPIIGASPFPTTGKGTVLVTSEMGYTVTSSRQFVPRWRTRVYIGPVRLTLKATYTVAKKRRTWKCTVPTFGTTKTVPTSNRWRTYQPSRGCTLPSDLYAQLRSRSAAMALSGTFDRRWATSGKKVRRDGSRISPRRVSLTIGRTDSVTLS